MNAASMDTYAIGIDMGGTFVKAGVVRNGKMLGRRQFPARAESGLRAGLPVIKAEVDDLMESLSLPLNGLTGVGIGFPGLVDSRRGRVLSTNQKYDDAIAIDLPLWAQEAWNVPAIVENDARAAAVGEWRAGAGKGCDDLVVMTIGTGIGTSAVVEGKLLRGKHFQAGVLGGHLTVQYNGRTCTCGNSGCLEAYAAAWSIDGIAREHVSLPESLLRKEPLYDYETIFRLAPQDALCAELVQTSIEIWAAGVVNLIHAYDPEKVILGGGIMKSHEKILSELVPLVQQHAWCPWGKVEIVKAELGDDAALIGLASCLEKEC